MLGKLLLWMVHRATPVPDNLAVCEFECRKRDCLMGDYEHCERRQCDARPPEQTPDD
ncbi:MAG: hypothetical protein JSW10_08380 [Pseudomonadota bacterium]|nr:MAG: hypothetical protein JSW10_08380 [Pseudomonadota bacterium]